MSLVQQYLTLPREFQCDACLKKFAKSIWAQGSTNRNHFDLWVLFYLQMANSGSPEPETPPARFLQPDDQLMGGLPSSLKLHTLRSFSEPNLAAKLMPSPPDKPQQPSRQSPGASSTTLSRDAATLFGMP